TGTGGGSAPGRRWLDGVWRRWVSGSGTSLPSCPVWCAASSVIAGRAGLVAGWHGCRRIACGSARGSSGEVLGPGSVDDGLWHVPLGPLRLGVRHDRSRTVVPRGPGCHHAPHHGPKCSAPHFVLRCSVVSPAAPASPAWVGSPRGSTGSCPCS